MPPTDLFALSYMVDKGWLWGGTLTDDKWKLDGEIVEWLKVGWIEMDSKLGFRITRQGEAACGRRSTPTTAPVIGRPPIAPEARKSSWLTIRLTKSERKKVDARARAYGISSSKWARVSLLTPERLADVVADAILAASQDGVAARVALRGQEDQDLGGLCRSSLIEIINTALHAFVILVDDCEPHLKPATCKSNSPRNR